MKKLLALVLCLMLLAAACAEGTRRQPRDPAGMTDVKSARSVIGAAQETQEIETTIDGCRLTVDKIAVTMNEQSFEPELTANIEASAREEGFDSFFCVNADGEELLQTLVGIGTYGVRMAFGDSQLYTFTPEYFADMGDDFRMAQTIPGLKFTADAEPVSASELVFEFADGLDVYAEDEFALDMSGTAQWLERRLGLGDGMLHAMYVAATGAEGFPVVKVKCEFGQYTFTIGDEDPVHLTMTCRDDLVTVKNNDSDFQLGAQFHADGTVQIAYGTGSAYSFAEDMRMSFKYKFTPDEAGGGAFSLSFEYWEYGKSFLHATGTVDADGLIDGNVRVTDEGSLLSVPFEVSCHIRTEYAELIDRTAGRREKLINEDTDEAFNGVAFAALGMVGDIERLYADEAVAGMADAYNAAWEEMYASYEEEPDVEISDLPFEVPEFTYIPEGFEKTDGTIYEFYYSETFTDGEERSLTISMAEDNGGETYVYVPGEGLTPVEGTVASYSAGDGYSSMTLNEDGVSTNIYTYGVVLSAEEMEKILESRVWSE